MTDDASPEYKRAARACAEMDGRPDRAGYEVEPGTMGSVEYATDR